MNELIEISNKLKFKPAIVEFDDTDFLANAEMMFAKYKDLVVSESNVKDSKKAATELNKIANGIDEARKAIAKEYNKPFDEFKEKIMPVKNKAKELRAEIIDQVSKYEAQEIENRKEAILREIRDEIAPSYNINDLDLSKIEPEFNEKWWNNKSYPKKQRLEEIASMFEQYKKEQEYQKNNLMLIQLKLDSYGMQDQFQAFNYDYLNNKLDIQDVLNKIDKVHEEQVEKEAIEKAKIEELKENLVEHEGTNYNQETGEKVVIHEQISLTIQGTKEDIDKIAQLVKELDLKIIGKAERKEVAITKF